MTQVKICGLRSVEEAEYLNKYGADYAGMVLFFPKSKRNIDLSQAKKIIDALEPSIKKVAVVVSPTLKQAKDLCLLGVDIIQVHGKLDMAVYDLISVDIWKAFNIKDMDQYLSYVSLDKIKGFVFDSAEPGSGQAYDRSILSKIQRPADKLFILAGGLRDKNVAQAIADTAPDVVDVSSGVEYTEAPGKDPDKVAAFITAVHEKNKG